MVTALEIAGRRIGAGEPCFVIAEAGVNHNGDAALAHALVDAAADAGADAVKFQTFDPALLASAAAGKAEYQRAGTDAGDSQLDMLRRLVLPREVHHELQAHAAARGILFLSTAFDEPSADFLESLDMPAFKVPSGELTNDFLLTHLARKGRPLLISTGMATLEEVATALARVRASGDPPVGLFHCVSSYPAAPADCNLAAIGTLRDAFGVPAGWSDHTLGLSISIASVAQGAELLEKHLTMDRGLPGPDHAASLEPAEMRDMIQAVRDVEAARGDGVKRPVPAERDVARVARRSLHFARDIAAGGRIGPDDLVALRPGTGISPSRRGIVAGHVVRTAVRAGTLVEDDHLG